MEAGIATTQAAPGPKKHYGGVEHFIGGTPSMRLRRLSELTGCEILGKAEFMNPGGSVMIALRIFNHYGGRSRRKAQGRDTIIEGTAGNTGIGLTVVGLAKGYPTVIVIPETQSVEKIQLLRTLGAKVITVPEKPYTDPGNYNRQAQRLAEENGWLWANQFDNVDNRLAHYKTTGPEIWKQTSGEVTAFVSSIGDGGTLAGTTQFLKKNAIQRSQLSVRILTAQRCGRGSNTETSTPKMAILSRKALARRA